MKKSFVLLILVLCLSFGSSIAQTVPTFYVNWGLNVPVGPTVFTEFWESSFANVGGGIGFDLQNNLEFIILAEWTKFQFVREKGFPVNEIGPVDRIAQNSIVTGTASLKYSFRLASWLNGYFLGGGGIAKLTPNSRIRFRDAIDFDNPPTDASQNILLFKDNDSWLATGTSEIAGTILGGFGFSIPQDNGAVTIDIRYMASFSEVDLTSFIPIKIGYSFKLE